MLSGYEKRLYHCDECGDFEVSTEGYHSCECGKYQGLQQGFEWGLSKHYDKGAFPFPPSSYNTIEKRVDDFAFLTDEENTLMAEMEADFDKFEDIDADVTIFRSETTMPDGRKETYSFHFEIEQMQWTQYQPVKTNTVYLGIDLTERCNGSYRQDLLENLKAFHTTMKQLIAKDLDLFKDSKSMQETHDFSNDYETIKVDKFVFYPTKDTVCS